MFSQLTFTSSDFSEDERTKIKELVEKNGGRYSGVMDASIDYLICRKVGSDKYMEAIKRQIYIVTLDWLSHSLSEKQRLPVSSFSLQIFEGLCFTTTGATLEEIRQVCRQIQSYGGKFETRLKYKETDILILYHNNITSQKYIWAKTNQMWIVDEFYVENCIRLKKFIHPIQYNEILAAQKKKEQELEEIKTWKIENDSNENLQTSEEIDSPSSSSSSSESLTSKINLKSFPKPESKISSEPILSTNSTISYLNEFILHPQCSIKTVERSIYQPNHLYNYTKCYYPVPQSFIFSSSIFYFYGSSTWKNTMIIKILERGGFWIHSITNYTTHIIVETVNDFHAVEKQLLTTSEVNNSNIFKDSYIDYCIESNSLQTPLYKHIWTAGLFGSLSFIIYPFEKDIDKVNQLILRYGGRILGVMDKNDGKEPKIEDYDYIVCPRTVWTKIYENPQSVSIYWLKDCILHNTVHKPDSSILYKPQLPLLDQKTVCLSAIEKEERVLLEKLIVSLKGTVAEKIHPSVDFLIVDRKYTAKVKEAKQNHIPIVSRQFLYDIAKKFEIPPIDSYLIDLSTLVPLSTTEPRPRKYSSSSIPGSTTPLLRCQSSMNNSMNSTNLTRNSDSTLTLSRDVMRTISSSIVNTIDKNITSNTNEKRVSTSNSKSKGPIYTSFSQLKEKTVNISKNIKVDGRQSLNSLLNQKEENQDRDSIVIGLMQNENSNSLPSTTINSNNQLQSSEYLSQNELSREVGMIHRESESQIQPKIELKKDIDEFDKDEDFQEEKGLDLNETSPSALENESKSKTKRIYRNPLVRGRGRKKSKY